MYKNIVNKINFLEINKNKNIINFKSGDFVNLEFIVDINKKKTQLFSGLIISFRNKSISSSIIIRKFSHGENIEKTFFIYSPNILKISVYKRIKTRKSKLFYIRNNNKKII